MKKSLPILVVATIGLFLSPSCSKKSNSSQPACQIITITDQNGSTTTTYNITYNNQGKISTEQYTLSSTNYNRVFTYIGNTEIVTTTDGTNTVTDSVTINSDGLIASDYTTTSSGNSVITYTYSGTEVQKAISVYNGGTPSTTTYTWSNGDLMSFSDGTTTTTLSYNSKASEPGDYWSIIQLVNYGGSFVRTSHQLSAYQAGTTIENINYTYDNSGKITVVTGTTGPNVETIDYQYSCQ